MSQEKGGSFERRVAWICHSCPICRYGREHPESLVGKILHHDLHAQHWPMWKAEKAVYTPGRSDALRTTAKGTLR